MNKNEKPHANGNGWQVRKREHPFECEIFDICVDHLQVDGKKQSYAYVVSPPAVVIIPITNKGEIITVRQYRYPVEEWCIETPAGGTHDTADESLEEVARKELREEIGGSAEVWTRIGAFYTSPSLTTEKCHIFLAEGVRLTQTPDREPTEKIKIEVRSAAEVLQFAREGKMQTAPCALALLMCEPVLRERGYLKVAS